MTEVIEYQVLGAYRIELLEKSVREEIKIGWQPFGSVMFSEGTGYIQTMVKYRPPPVFRDTR